MKFYTWCNIPNHPKVTVLELSAKRFNIPITILGSGIKWTRNYLKIQLLYDAIKDLDNNEIILCSDAFDVLYLAGEQQILEKFLTFNGKIVFGAEKLYSHHYPKYKNFWDTIGEKYDYKYLNSGTFIGYQKDILTMLTNILNTSKNYTESSDQKLYGKYVVKNPDKVVLDYTAKLFWCPAGEQKILEKLYKIENKTEDNYQIQLILRNLKTDTTPCLIHITHSKKYYGLLLNVALKLKLITSNEKDSFLKLHITDERKSMLAKKKR